MLDNDRVFQRSGCDEMCIFDVHQSDETKRANLWGREVLNILFFPLNLNHFLEAKCLWKTLILFILVSNRIFIYCLEKGYEEMSRNKMMI